MSVAESLAQILLLESGAALQFRCELQAGLLVTFTHSPITAVTLRSASNKKLKAALCPGSRTFLPSALGFRGEPSFTQQVFLTDDKVP